MATCTGAGLVALILVVAGCGSAAPRAAVPPSPVPAFVSPAPPATQSPSPSASPRPTERVLDIQIHYQEHNLTCEAAALKMALAYEGINVDEMTLIGYMTRDPRAANFNSHGN